MLRERASRANGAVVGRRLSTVLIDGGGQELIKPTALHTRTHTHTGIRSYSEREAISKTQRLSRIDRCN